MEEKKSIKINLSTLFLIFTILIIIAMGYYIYLQKSNYNHTISNLEASNLDMQNTINNLQGKIDTISNTINSNTTTQPNNSEDKNLNNTDNKFSDNEIKLALENYLKIFKGHGSPEGLLTNLGFSNFSNTRTTDNYIKTDIQYSDFKSMVLNYVTEDFFNTINNNQKWEIIEFKEQDGLLYYHNSGWTGTDYEIESITLKGDYSASTYIATIHTINLDNSKGESENIQFSIENYNGKCVISYCD